MVRPAGMHPSIAEASAIVFRACSDKPSANKGSAIGTLYPLPDERSLFRQRVCNEAKDDGFKMTQAQVPSGDSNTIQDVITAVNQNAVS